MPARVAADAADASSTSLAEINVVPLVDVMLVLLIIFMVTAPMIQRGVDVKLPVAARAQQIQGERVYVTIPSSIPAVRTWCISATEALRLDDPAGAGAARKSRA